MVNFLFTQQWLLTSLNSSDIHNYYYDKILMSLGLICYSDPKQYLQGDLVTIIIFFGSPSYYLHIVLSPQADQ